MQCVTVIPHTFQRLLYDPPLGKCWRFVQMSTDRDYEMLGKSFLVYDIYEL